MKISLENGIYILQSVTKEDPGFDIWFLHGYGESGFSFQEAFYYMRDYNLYVPDMAGFGSSLPQNGILTLQDHADLLEKTISLISSARPVILVGHSLGGLIQTLIAKNRRLNLRGLIFIDSPLYKSEIFIASKIEDFNDPEKAIHSIRKWMQSISNNKIYMHRYLASLWRANPKCFLALANDLLEYVEHNTLVEEYIKPDVPKLFIVRGDGVRPEDNLKRLYEENVTVNVVDKAGHWPMIEYPENVYNGIIRQWIENTN